MNFLTQFRDRWIWVHTVLSVYPTFQKFNEELKREKAESYQSGYNAGRQAGREEQWMRMAKAANN